MARKPAAPSGLTAEAKRVWTQTLENYSLREDELSILRQYVKTLSLIEKMQSHLEEDLEAGELTARASHGGTQVNVLMPEIRQQRNSLVSLWKALKLPELDAGETEESEDDRVVPMSREESARKAANTRWSKRG